VMYKYDTTPIQFNLLDSVTPPDETFKDILKRNSVVLTKDSLK
jgi:hypothetical protein